ncbi:hypothetical protein PHYPO_G00127270 [Pangasianodon hypophthalmus]|uniref:Uncharacterized protein n=1 Tax=Pangasianodon hypophthalmus TaxID=310915 RepID=A0A5N5KSF7_PANHP|nr:hypothetical protein PHYPO_G00127270 [Pangasianodon hypophthalmus]
MEGGAGEAPPSHLFPGLLIGHTRDLQCVSKLTWKQLEDQYLCLQEEITLLKQHVQILEWKLHRFSTKLSKLRNGHSGLAGGQNVEAKDTIEELKDRVATLESQKEVLQRKLIMARQQILALGRHTHQSPRMGRGVQPEGEVTQTSQTVPAHYALSSMDDYKGQTERFFTEPQPVRLTELDLAIHSLRETFTLKEKELEYPMKELHKQQIDGLRLTIKDNVDVIRLQKQLSNERTAVLVIKDKFTVLKQAYETQLEENSFAALAERVTDIETRLTEAEQRISSAEDSATVTDGQLANLKIVVEQLQAKMDDLENRGCRKNLKIVGLPEEAEGTIPLASFLQDVIPKWLELPPDFHNIDIDWGHRSPTFISNNSN